MSGIVAAAAIGAAGSIFGGIIGGSNAKKQARRAARERERIGRQMAAFEAGRQEVINPFSDVTSLSGLIDEMRGDLSSPFANLGVATGAAEIQMEQTDIALANTLDVLQATGASAGGATALAQAAKQSKKEVAANIEAQEAQNEKLRAQGEQALQAKEMQLTQMEISEEARIQQAEAAGKQFMFSAQEARDMATLDRMQAGIDQANVNQANANMARAQSTAGMISGISSAAAGLMSSGAFAEGGSLNPGTGTTGTGTTGTGTSGFGGYTGSEFNNGTGYTPGTNPFGSD